MARAHFFRRTDPISSEHDNVPRSADPKGLFVEFVQIWQAAMAAARGVPRVSPVPTLTPDRRFSAFKSPLPQKRPTNATSKRPPATAGDNASSSVVRVAWDSLSLVTARSRPAMSVPFTMQRWKRPRTFTPPLRRDSIHPRDGFVKASVQQ